jgi:hypothetical protein
LGKIPVEILRSIKLPKRESDLIRRSRVDSLTHFLPASGRRQREGLGAALGLGMSVSRPSFLAPRLILNAVSY